MSYWYYMFYVPQCIACIAHFDEHLFYVLFPAYVDLLVHGVYLVCDLFSKVVSNTVYSIERYSN